MTDPGPNRIAYRECKRKYTLEQTYTIQTDIRVPALAYTHGVTLWPDGRLVINQGWCWDGPSGPTIDSRWTLRASLVHDALYLLMRHGLLDELNRPYADRLFEEILKEDAATLRNPIRRWFGKYIRSDAWYNAVRWFAKSAVDPQDDPPILYAP